MDDSFTKPKLSWADEVDSDNYVDEGLPRPIEYIKDNFKYVTFYRFNDKGSVEKVERTYKLQKVLVPKSVVRRRQLKKFGDSANDEPGPNSKTTVVSEEIFMDYSRAKAQKQLELPAPLEEKKMAKCRICGGQHWSVNCTYKHSSMDHNTLMEMNATNAAAAVVNDASKTGQGKYVPPSLRDKANPSERMHEKSTIRLTNLSPSVTEDDLDDLVSVFGPVTRKYLPREKNTGICKGYAFVSFRNHTDAVRAMEVLDGYGYDHLLIRVSWGRPTN